MYIVIYVCRQKVSDKASCSRADISQLLSPYTKNGIHAHSLYGLDIVVAIVCAVPRKYSGKYIWLTIKLSDTEREGTPECLLHRVASY